VGDVFCADRDEGGGVAGTRGQVIRAGLEALYVSGAHILARPLLGGVGAILMLHHVRPPRLDPFQPNRLLEVSPAFLEDVVRYLRGAGIDLVSLDEMHERMASGRFGRRFACFTFDDGYRDNLQYAYPILKKHQVPFAIYIPTSFPDQIGDLWWLTLESVIARHDRIGLVIDGADKHFVCVTPEEKDETFARLYWWLRGFPDEREMRRVIRELAARYGVDADAFCRDLCMTWPELEQLAADPLVTIGAHTVDHIMLKKASDAVARNEMQQGASVIEAALGKRPRHFAYPVGDPTSAGQRDFALAAELGFKTAVTTRPGILFPQHRGHLHALPRISLNGEYQRLRYVKVLLSGAPTLLWNRGRKLNVG
jgi:peptidoglycan/xylan/chitin deacetylase (PgdA/CDA1 family)